jgi:acetyl esterase/lipase
MLDTSAAPPVRETQVYKVIDGHALEADVIGACPGASKPCLVWIHGGGLIFGWRKTSPRPAFVSALLEHGFVVVSIDHRLAPETKLPGIVDDVRDAWRWVHEVGPAQFGIDPARLVLAGASAGAYLSLLGGQLLTPQPRALASFWGYGDITAPWEAEPSAYYRQMDLVTRDEALASLSAPPVQDPKLGVDRSCFYLYCRQQGAWLAEVTARKPTIDAAWFDRYCPIRMLDARSPPTVLVHGEDDKDVPHEESVRLAARLDELAVPHRFISLAGVGHGFAGARPGEPEATEQAVLAFLCEQLVVRG